MIFLDTLLFHLLTFTVMTKHEDSIIYPAVILLPVVNNCYCHFTKSGDFTRLPPNKIHDADLYFASKVTLISMTRRIWILKNISFLVQWDSLFWLQECISRPCSTDPRAKETDRFSSWFKTRSLVQMSQGTRLRHWWVRWCYGERHVSWLRGCDWWSESCTWRGKWIGTWNGRCKTRSLVWTGKLRKLRHCWWSIKMVLRRFSFYFDSKVAMMPINFFWWRYVRHSGNCNLSNYTWIQLKKIRDFNRALTHIWPLR